MSEQKKEFLECIGLIAIYLGVSAALVTCLVATVVTISEAKKLKASVARIEATLDAMRSGQ